MFIAVAIMACSIASPQDKVEFKMGDGEVDVLIGGDPFATVHYADRSRPYVYPVYGPTGAQMLRNYPFIEGVEGESSDHPHHTGVWFAHGDMNGVDMWHQKGSMTVRAKPQLTGPSITLVLNMRDSEGVIFGQCTQRLTFGTSGESARFIDYDILLAPIAGGSLVFGDTKEGMMGVRTHPNLRLDRPGGNVLNSEGVSGPQVWGRRAAWIDYWGTIDGEVVGIAMFDHPKNPRHPTWWHAREYGLFAANPFGVFEFEDKPPGTGDMQLGVDEKVRFRYRLLFHTGTAKSAVIDEQYRTWADGEKD
ncbi:MAG: PmoA family protein [Armatimonadetes bacterium]|nr:PmoA family protein [Armatimonadota bacterium]